MTKDEKIKEVMELVEEYGKDSFSHGLGIVERINSKDDEGVRDDAHKLWDKCKVIESKLRELIQ